MSIHTKLNSLFEKYDVDEEGLVNHLQSKYPLEYKNALTSLKEEGVDDPEAELTPGRIADYISASKEKAFLEVVETYLKNTSF